MSFYRKWLATRQELVSSIKILEERVEELRDENANLRFAEEGYKEAEQRRHLWPGERVSMEHAMRVAEGQRDKAMEDAKNMQRQLDTALEEAVKWRILALNQDETDPGGELGSPPAEAV